MDVFFRPKLMLFCCLKPMWMRLSSPCKATTRESHEIAINFSDGDLPKAVHLYTHHGNTTKEVKFFTKTKEENFQEMCLILITCIIHFYLMFFKNNFLAFVILFISTIIYGKKVIPVAVQTKGATCALCAAATDKSPSSSSQCEAPSVYECPWLSITHAPLLTNKT